MTAGAHSSQPSLRSARAPSDSWRLRLGGASAGAPTVAVWVLVLTGPLLSSSSRPGRCSRDQALRLQGVVELADQRILGARRADAARRRDQGRDADGHDLVDRRLRPTAPVPERGPTVAVERAV